MFVINGNKSWDHPLLRDCSASEPGNLSGQGSTERLGERKASVVGIFHVPHLLHQPSSLCCTWAWSTLQMEDEDDWDGGWWPGWGRTRTWGDRSNSHVTNTLQLTKHFHVFLGTQACKTIYGMPSGSQALPKPRMELLVQVFFSHADLTDHWDMGSKQITTPALWHRTVIWRPPLDPYVRQWDADWWMHLCPVV